MRSWAGTITTAAAGGAVTVALLLASGAVQTRDGGMLGELPGAIQGGLVSAAGGQRSAGDVYGAAAPAVVSVRARAVMDARSPFAPVRRAGAVTAASGFVIDAEKGLVVCSAHTVAAASDVTVTLPDGRALAARALGRDDETDLALLAVDPEGVELTALELAPGAAARAGDPTLALANAEGRTPSLTTGVISATRTRLVGDGGFTLDGVIQTDAPTASGDAGGPLLDAGGQVIGVVGRLMVAGVPVGFAVPASTVARLVPELETSGRVRRALLGIRGDGPDKAGGLRVEAVRPGSPAERAGLRRGDTLRALAGERVRSLDDLGRVLAGHAPGERVPLAVGRGGRPMTREVRLADRPAGVAER